MKTIIDSHLLDVIISRLSHQLIEKYKDFENTAIIGIQPRGINFSDILVERINTFLPKNKLEYGKLDITFYRDDVYTESEIFIPKETDLPFSLDNKKVILIDDVLYTGRTIRAAMDALIDHGRPIDIALMVLINRRFKRQMPIQADYIGRNIDTIDSQKVKVIWDTNPKQRKIILIDKVK